MVNQGRGPGQRTDPDRRPTKAERKEQARIEREQIQRTIAARRRNRTLLTAGSVLVIAAVVLVVAVTSGGGTSSPPDASSLPGMLITPPPWPANTAELRQRLDDLNLPGTSNDINHHHAYLQIYVDGQQQPVPANIGIDQATSAFSPLHTHDTTGQIHIEPDIPDFNGTLGQFFDVWGVQLTPDCIGALCDAGESTLRVFVNGTAFDGDPRTVQLNEGTMIVLAYGTSDQLPDPIPSAPPSA